MNIPNFITFCALFFILQCQRITSSTVDNRKNGTDEGYWESYSSKLKDENEKLVKRLLDIADNKDQVKANNQRMEELQKTNEDLRKTINILGESVLTQKANTAKLDDFINNMIYKQKTEIEDLKLKAGKSIEEDIVVQDNFKKEIQQWKNQLLTNMKKIEDSEKQLKMERNLRESLEKEIANNNNWIRETELRVKNELKDHNVKKEKLESQIEELNAQIETYKKQLEESQNKLTVKNSYIESNSLKFAEKTIVDCKELTGKYVKASCKGLETKHYDFNITGVGFFSAGCDNSIEDGGWMEINFRYDDGKANCYKNWTEYRDGFMKSPIDFFIGLEKMHRITNMETYELYILLVYNNKKTDFARYDNFRIGNETSGYVLESLGEFNGTLNDEMRRNLNKKFFTNAQDNDHMGLNCGMECSDAWSFDDYKGANLHGKNIDGSNNTLFKQHFVSFFIRPKSEIL